MAIVALLCGSVEPPLAPLTVAGAGLVERQVRQGYRAGAARIYVLGGRCRYGFATVNLDTAAMLGPRLNDGDMVLVLAAGLVADDRIVEAVSAAARHSGGAAPVVATWPTAAVQRGVERIDALTFAAGVAMYPAALVRRVVANLGGWDLASTLMRAALCEPGCVRVDLASVTSASAIGLQHDPLTYALVDDPDSASAATAAVLSASARPRGDALGRYLYPPIERFLLRWLAPAPVTPLAIAATVSGVGISAAVAFGVGWLWTGLALALLFGPLQDIAGRVAEARVLPSLRGWQVQATAIGYGWWLALAVKLTLVRGNGGPLAVAAMILLTQITAVSETRALQRATGGGTNPANAISRRIALFAADRDSLALSLVPFALAAQWYAGLIALAVYAVASVAVTHARFLRQVSP